MTFIDGFLIAYIVISVAALLWFMPKIVSFRYAFKELPRKKATGMRKISVLVPARDESETIGPLLESIKRQDYPTEYFTLNVIVKDPDDPTIVLVEEMGGKVFVVPDQTCKGEALNGYFKAVGAEGIAEFDSFVIVDADGVLSPDYLSSLNEALEYKFDIFITRKHNLNLLWGRESRSVYSNCSALLWPAMEDLGNSWRAQHNAPLNLCAQGMMLRRGVIESIGGWPYHTLTEDCELKLDSFLKGFKTLYYTHAIIYTEEAITHKENYKRRLRWLTGHAQCDRLYRARIKEQYKKEKLAGGKNIAVHDYLYGYWPVVLFFIGTAISVLAGLTLGTIYFLSGDKQWYLAYMLLTVMPVGILLGILWIFTAMTYAVGRDIFRTLPRREKAAMILYNPIYLLEFGPLYIEGWINARRNKQPKWEVTERVKHADAALEVGEDNVNSEEDTDNKEENTDNEEKAD